jgi:teichoic acid transport system ATP-binding protein
MTYRSPARWLAPLALAGAVVALLITLSIGGSSNGSGADSAGTKPRAATQAAATRTTTTAAAKSAPRTYSVKPGDVLSAIAEKTGVSLQRIEELNPNVDAQTLHAGQQIKLSP